MHEPTLSNAPHPGTVALLCLTGERGIESERGRRTSYFFGSGPRPLPGRGRSLSSFLYASESPSSRCLSVSPTPPSTSAHVSRIRFSAAVATVFSTDCECCPSDVAEASSHWFAAACSRLL